ncbi:MAG: hypothetical protein HQL87_15800 [Magnetococcales bacterium]|nr:hypothetical protein [Magnetococcales bacterium]
MDLIRLPSSPSAEDLYQEWLGHLGHMELVRYQEVVNRLLSVLFVAPPGAFHALLGLQSHHIFKKRRLNACYPSLQVFVWLKALEQAQPPYADRLLRLLRRTCAQRPADKRRMATIDRHLALFALLTDRFVEEGFMSVAHHVVLRVLGDFTQKPTRLIASVQLADYLDRLFETYLTQFQSMEIRP